ncbi:hypothetical protein [Archangium primigenium]|uniref:hypothetical protein n=1 Tax=[Archangium] primigenium TaxID=2792470 RepID=UPI00195DE585|nr:hypothetical protein [Archangium primigenium]MBM7117947.1 hypothetical protein [Archangium primigenium]
MIQSFNYTNRALISPQDAVIRISISDKAKGGEPGVIRFNLDARLDKNYEFPQDAPLVIEAYSYLYYKRFEFGTVGKPEPRIGSEPQLEADGWESLLFRVKVIDPQHSGRILGEADRLRPVLLRPGVGESSGNKRSLLSVTSEDLGQQVWMLRFDLSGPTVVVNKGHPELRRRMEDQLYRWLVFPEVMQRVLERILCVEGVDFDGASPSAESWRGDWLAFATNLYQPPPAPDGDRKEDQLKWADWSAEVVRRFCGKHSAWDVVSKALTEEVKS